MQAKALKTTQAISRSGGSGDGQCMESAGMKDQRRDIGVDLNGFYFEQGNIVIAGSRLACSGCRCGCPAMVSTRPQRDRASRLLGLRAQSARAEDAGYVDSVGKD